MKSSRLVVLEDVSSYSSGKTEINEINEENYISTENLLPNYGGKTIASGLPNVNKVTEYKRDDVLISNIRPYFKKIWRASYTGGASNDVLVIRPKTGIIPEYLYYNLANDKFFEYVMSGAKGTKMPRGDKKHIMGFKFNLPSLQEQKSIAHILSTLDDKIEVNNQINKTLENMAQAIFKQWFVDFEFPNEDGEPYQSSGGEMVDSELGMIPKGWEVKTLGDIALITMGQSPKGTSYNETGEGVVFYQGRTDFTKRFPERRLYTTEPKRMAKSGDILMSVRAPVGDINIANEECCIGRGLCALSSQKDYNSFLHYLMLNLKERFNVFNGEGTVFGSINKNDLNGMKVVIGSDYVLEKFECVIKNMDNQYHILEKESRRIVEIRDILLPKLMSGEIRVPLDSEGEVS